MKRIHFIAMGGSAMHNLALTLHESGYIISGSDDEFRDPSRTRLKNAGILPDQTGWFPDKIHPGLDAVILGMHARKDNPELKRALELNIPVYSYPEFLFKASEHTLRVVVGGSHGKTTTTSALLYALKKKVIPMNYMVGARIKSFRNMVEIDPRASVSVFEGDEYLTSPLDPRPKFHWYRPHIAILTGIAWDHYNVFPTFEEYVNQFSVFIDTMERFSTLIYDVEDLTLKKLVEDHPRNDIQKIPYVVPSYAITDNGTTTVQYLGKNYPLKVFGRHNLKNLEAASLAYVALGNHAGEFWEAMTDFEGAEGRLEKWFQVENLIVLRDFAHAPSKVQSTIAAVKEHFASYALYAILELHTFSSLNREFLPQYKHTMDMADNAVVFYDRQTLEHKHLSPLEGSYVKDCFSHPHLQVFSDIHDLDQYLQALLNHSFSHEKKVILLMSSGNFQGLDKEQFRKDYLMKFSKT